MEQAYTLNFIKNIPNARRKFFAAFYFPLLITLLSFFFALQGQGQIVTGTGNYYYSKATGDLAETSTWGTDPTGSGTSPVSFTNDRQVFEIRNRTTATIAKDWTVSGSYSKVIVGSDLHFSILATSVVSAIIDVNSGGILTMFNSKMPTLSQLDKASTVEYAQDMPANIANTQLAFATDPAPLVYGSLKLSGVGTKTFSAGITTVAGNLLLDGASWGDLTVDAAAAAPFSTVVLRADLIYSGVVNTTSNYFSLATSGKGQQNIIGNNNTARLSQLTVSGSVGCNLNLQGLAALVVGDSNGGGLTINAGCFITLNDNTLVWAQKGTISGKGTITGSPNASIIINKTDAAPFGTLYFTNGAAILKNLTINHTGSALATITLGSSLDILDNLNLVAGTLVMGNNMLTLRGPVNATGPSVTSGTLTGSRGSNLTIGGVAEGQALRFNQTNEDTRSLANLVLLSGSSSVLVTALDVYGSVVLNSAKLNLNDQHLTLKSNQDGTARIGNLSGSILSGASNITVERYIPQLQHRAWRLLSVPVTSGSQTINQAWQNAQPAGVTGPAGMGTWITSNNGNSTFDAQSQGNSLETYNSITGAYDGVGSTALPITSDQGYMLYIRGDRLATNANSIINPTTLSTTGILKQGDYPVTPLSVSAGQFKVIGNPYPSEIDLTRIKTGGGVQNSFYVWDPMLTGVNGLGAFQTLTYNPGADTYDVTPGGGSYPAQTKYIQSGQAFFVHASGNSGTVSFTENSKSDGTSNIGYKNTFVTNQLRSNLYSINGGKSYLLDGTLSVYQNSNSTDVVKLKNFGENLAIAKDGMMLVASGARTINNGDNILFNISNLRQQEYQLEFQATQLAHPGLQAFLKDSYTGISTPLNLNGNSSVNFTVSGDPASSATDRFRVVFVKSTDIPPVYSLNEAAGKPAIAVYPNPVTGGIFNLYLNGMDAGLYRIRVLNNQGEVVLVQNLLHNGGKGAQRVTVGNNLTSGNYLLQLIQPNNNRISTQLIIAR